MKLKKLLMLIKVDFLVKLMTILKLDYLVIAEVEGYAIIAASNY